MVEDRVEVLKDGDILIIHTGYHHYGWDQPEADEIRYMVKHPGPDREFAEARCLKLRWLGVDQERGPPDEHDHPTWMPRQAKEADAHFRAKYGKPLDEYYDDGKYQLMHLELFNHGIIHAECLGGDIDLLLNQRAPSSARSRGASSTASRASAASSRSSTTTATRRSWRRRRRP